MEFLLVMVLHCVALAIVALFTIISILRTIRQDRLALAIKQQNQRYKDKDGIATEESQKAYSVRTQNILATLISLTGFGVSLAGAVRATVAAEYRVIEWQCFSLWVCFIHTMKTNIY
jgi:hypothetical protein